mmetsp:Transcript_13033/g.23756  ORF Transcript_13033/g.23756 Transcript_13033/m.23756 type:complete len:314 (+) Transcript_13033:1257-2198(+)
MIKITPEQRATGGAVNARQLPALDLHSRGSACGPGVATPASAVAEFRGAADPAHATAKATTSLTGSDNRSPFSSSKSRSGGSKWSQCGCAARSRAAGHRAHVDEQAAGLVLHDAEIVVHVQQPDAAGRLFLVPGQQLPHGVDRHPLVHDGAGHEGDPGHTGGVDDLRPLQFHRQHVALQFQVFGLGHDTASKRRQQLKPAHDGDDSQAKDGCVKIRLHRLLLKVNALRHFSDGGDSPRAHLQQMQLEEQVTLAWIIERLLDCQEKRAASEQFHGRIHQLPLSCHFLLRDIARMVVDQFFNKVLHHVLTVLHGV